MNKNHLSVLAGAMALSLPLSVLAQAGTSDPTQPRQATPPLRYDSAFTDYKPWQDTKRADWRAVNDALRDAPKGDAHAGRGAAAPAAAVPAAAASAQAPKPVPAPARPAASPPRKPPLPASAPPADEHSGHAGHGDKK